MKRIQVVEQGVLTWNGGDRSSGSATGTAVRVPQISDLLTALALVLVIEGLVGANRGDGHYLAYFVSQCLEFKLY